VKHIGRSKMGAKSLGALVGGAIYSMSGDDSAADGAMMYGSPLNSGGQQIYVADRTRQL
jgi:hypothetical protein